MENIMHSEYAIGKISAFIIMTSCNTVIILPDTMTSRACSGSRDQLPLQMEEKKQMNLSHITFGLLEIQFQDCISMVSFLQQSYFEFCER